MVNLKYKNICVSDITIDAPEKSSDGYISSVKLHGEQLAFQTPKLEILSKDTLRFDMVKEPLFYSFLEDLQDFFTSHLSKNSVEFFKGKKFSEEKIRESLEVMKEIDGQVYLRNIDLGDCTFFDLLHEETSAPISFPYTGHCIIQLGSLRYVKSSVVPAINVVSIKIGKDPRVKPESCVLLDEEPCEEEPCEEDNLDFFEEE